MWIRSVFTALLITIHIAVSACSGDIVTSPTALNLRSGELSSLGSGATAIASDVPPVSGVIVGFADIGPEGPPITTYPEAGFVVSATLGSWTANDYGSPGPSIQFESPAGVTTEGEVIVTQEDRMPFRLASVDLYSSITQIPYVITGTLRGRTVFTEAGQLWYTRGNFVRVYNPHENAVVDTILIRLTNAAFSCCSNPMGLDNIALQRLRPTNPGS